MTITANTLEFGKSPSVKSKVTFAPFTIADLDWSMDDEVLSLTVAGLSPESDGTYPVHADGLAYVIQYGLQQSLTDSYAQDTTRAKAAVKFAKRLAKIIKGEMSLDGTASGDPVRGEMRKLATARLCELAGKSESAVRKELGKSFSRKVNDLLAKFEAVFRKRAELIVELRNQEMDFNLDAQAEDGDESQPEVEAEVEEATPAEVVQPKAEGKKSSRRKAA